VLYVLSDCLFVLLYHIVGYRKAVVLENLRNAFPEKNESEIQAICKRFFRYFCDLFLETFKTLTISKSNMLKHCSIDPSVEQLFNRFADDNVSLIIVLGHFGNWEWAGNTFSICCRHQLYVIYHPLGNKYFNDLVIKMRTRFGTRLIAMKDTFRDMLRNKDELNATAFIADQTPLPDRAYWMSFLNQETPVFVGTEKIALKLKYPVVYVSVNRTARGYYTLMADILKVPPFPTVEGEITEAHTRRLERDIVARPEFWLWTHRRWKHKKM
jgi:KDO2-lipid IV(A) lauroyltransferase